MKATPPTRCRILSVTTLGILASLLPSVNRIKSSFQLGMYFIYVFCLIVATKADIASLFATRATRRC
ncbi:MAG: hypothetical protein R2751_08295 [Bacteroidales bacterium]